MLVLKWVSLKATLKDQKAAIRNALMTAPQLDWPAYPIPRVAGLEAYSDFESLWDAYSETVSFYLGPPGPRERTGPTSPTPPRNIMSRSCRATPITHRQGCRYHRAPETVLAGPHRVDYHFSMTITIDRAGRIVLPKPIRDRFNLRPGTELELDTDAEGIRLRPAATTGALEMRDGLLVHTGSAATDIDIAAFIRDERERETGRRAAELMQS